MNSYATQTYFSVFNINPLTYIFDEVYAILLSLVCITLSIALGYKKITIHKTDGDVILCCIKNFIIDRKPEPLRHSLEKEVKVEIMSLDSIAKIQHKEHIYYLSSSISQYHKRYN